MPTLEMTISREDFLRLLPAAVGQTQVDGVEGQFSGGGDGRRWILRLSALPDRRLGSVVLPCHQVELRFEGYSDEDEAAFLARFHQGFQRGGG